MSSGQAADVVVRLDLRGDAVVAARLDHVGVERALDEEAHVAELAGLLLEDADELLADDLALRLGVADAGELREEALLAPGRARAARGSGRRTSRRPARPRSRACRPWSTKTQVSWSPTALWTSSAATAESTPPERPQMTRSRADLRPDPLDLLLDHGGRRPARRRAGDLVEEVLQDLLPVAACARPRGGTGRRRGRARRPRRPRSASTATTAVTRAPGRRRGDRVAVAHPARPARAAGRGRAPTRRARRRPCRTRRRRSTRRCRRGRAPSAACRNRCRASGSRARASPVSSCGAPSAYTEAGPPERISASGLRGADLGRRRACG